MSVDVIKKGIKISCKIMYPKWLLLFGVLTNAIGKREASPSLLSHVDSESLDVIPERLFGLPLNSESMEVDLTAVNFQYFI